MSHLASAVKPLFTPSSLVIEDRCALSIPEEIIQELEPMLERVATTIARRFPATVNDLIQEARIALWELDVGRFCRGDEATLEQILHARMVETYRNELRGGLTAKPRAVVRKD